MFFSKSDKMIPKLGEVNSGELRKEKKKMSKAWFTKVKGVDYLIIT